MVCTIMTWSNKLLSIEAQGTDSQSSPQAPGEVKSRANKDAVHKIKGRKPLNKKKSSYFFGANHRHKDQKRKTENMGTCSYLRPYPDHRSRAPLPEQHLYEHSKKFRYQAMAKYALSSKVEARGENMRAH